MLHTVVIPIEPPIYSYIRIIVYRQPFFVAFSLFWSRNCIFFRTHNQLVVSSRNTTEGVMRISCSSICLDLPLKLLTSPSTISNLAVFGSSIYITKRVMRFSYYSICLDLPLKLVAKPQNDIYFYTFLHNVFEANHYFNCAHIDVHYIFISI